MKEELVIIHDPEWLQTYPDDLVLINFLEETFTTSIMDWQGIQPESLKNTSVFIRCPSAYVEKNKAFLDWLDETAKVSKKIVNSPTLLRRYLSKEYLVRLQDSDICIVPTLLVSTIDDWKSVPWEEIIIKPIFGESSLGVQKVFKGAAFPGPVLAQKYMATIEEGEISTIIIDNKLSHCVERKLRDTESFIMDWENYSLYDPPLLLQKEVEKVLACDDFSGSYLRLDWIREGEKFFLSEIEAIDPVLFLGSLDKKKQSDVLEKLLQLLHY